MTSLERGPSWSERLNPRNWTLAWKLVAVGLVPALLALVLGVLRVVEQADTATTYGVVERYIDVQAGTADLVARLQAERARAAAVAGGDREQAARSALAEAEAATDAGAVALSAQVQEAGEVLGAEVRTAFAPVADATARLGELRERVRAEPPAPSTEVVEGYTAAVSPVLGFDTALLVEQLDAAGAAGGDRAVYSLALYGLAGAREQISVQHAVLGAALASGTLSDAGRDAVTAADARLRAAVAEIAANPNPQLRELFAGLANAPEFLAREQLKNQILAGEGLDPAGLAAWDRVNDDLLTSLTTLQGEVRDIRRAVSTGEQEAASNLAGVNAVLLMLGLLLAGALIVLVARSLLRSLKVLRGAALDVAQRRLPMAVERMRAGESPDAAAIEPVPLTSRDEVGQVARAFDAVHSQAVRLAADQAALRTNVSNMFVNLSRRSQALVERQLNLIERLEAGEQDPDQLANLFQLDHLATRMRRNSENLLVLAGTDLAKRNVAPVPVVDVLRAAVSEIEQYQRVVVQTPPQVRLLGRAASDIVHLLAELLDNATNFSPPDSQVVMSTTRTPDGAVVIEIADLGVGMGEQEVGEANDRLAGPAAVDVSASRRMGLFVVGRLAGRHGIAVRLTGSAAGRGNGLTASVTVPAHLVPEADAGTGGVPVVRPAEDTESPGDVPPQRLGVNGAGRVGNLSALVAGTDGPMTPAGVFDAAPEAPPALNGGGPGLPVRRPGSALQPELGGTTEAPQDPPADAPRPPAPRPRPTPAGAPSAGTAAPEGAVPAASGSPSGTDRNGSAQARADDPVDRPAVDRNGSARSAPERDGAERSEPAAPGPAEGSDEDAAPDGGSTPERLGTPPPSPRPDAGGPPASPRGRDTSGGTSAPTRVATAGGLPSRVPGAATPPPSSDLPVRRPGAAIPERASADAGSTSGLFAAATPAPPGSARRPGAAVQASVSAPVQAPAPPRAPTQPQALAPAPAGQPDGEAEDGGTTPIFEEIASAWFRSNRPVPVTWDTGQHPIPTRDAGPAEPANPRPVPPAAQAAPAAPARPTTRRPAEPRQAPPAPAPAPSPDGPTPGRQGGAAAAPHTTGGPAARPPAGGQTPAAPQAPAPQAPAPQTPAPQTPAQQAPAQQAPAPHPAAPRSAGPPTPAPHPTAPPAAHPAAAPAGAAAPPPVPAVPAGDDPAGRAGGPVDATAGRAPTGDGGPAAGATRIPDAPRPDGPVTPVGSPAPAADPAQPLAARPAAAQPDAGAARLTTASAGFASAADEGWLAASSAAGDDPEETTSAGLPKRRPRARLVPGSAGSAVLAAPVSSSRSAESIRGRLAAYQQGVRQGRETRLARRDAMSVSHAGAQPEHDNEPAAAGGNHDEESR